MLVAISRIRNLCFKYFHRIMGINRCLDGKSRLPSFTTINSEEKKFTQWMWSRRCGAVLSILALILVASVIVVSVNFSNNDDAESGETTRDPTTSVTEKTVTDSVTDTTSVTNPDDTDSVRFIEREEWGAKPPSEKLNNLIVVPAPYVIISHTVTEPCKIENECVLLVRNVQNLHMGSQHHWSDIGYNFLVGGDGFAYVGRGWDAEGAHAHGWNDKSIGISFIGDFDDVKPCERQLLAASRAIEVGVKLDKISKSYKLLGHRQVSNTSSPGDKLYEILKTWDHWSPKP